MANLTPTQTKALQLLDKEFKAGLKVYALWIDGTTISKATMQALAKKGYLKLSNVETIKYSVSGNFGRNHPTTRIEACAYYVRVLNFKGELV